MMLLVVMQAGMEGYGGQEEEQDSAARERDGPGFAGTARQTSGKTSTAESWSTLYQVGIPEGLSEGVGVTETPLNLALPL